VIGCLFQSVVTNESLSALVDGLPAMLYRQYAYEEPIVRSGRHLMHSAFFKVSAVFSFVHLRLMFSHRALLCFTFLPSPTVLKDIIIRPPGTVVPGGLMFYC